MKLYLLATAALAAFASSSIMRHAEAAALKPVVVSEFDATDNMDLVAYLGTDANIYQLNNTPSGWSWVSATGIGNGPTIVAGTYFETHVNTIYGPNEIHYLTNVGGSLHVEQLYNQNFFAQDLTAIASGLPAAPGSALVGYIDPTAYTDNIFYLGADQFVHHLDWSPYPGWHEDTGLDGTPTTNAAVGSPLSGHLAGNSVETNSDEIFYLGTNHHVYEVWRWSSPQKFDGWHPIDVTLANGPKPKAASRSPLAGFYDPTSGNDAMFYVGTNQHVYELLFTRQSVWQSVDLMAGSGAPNTAAPTSALAAHLNTISGSEEVFYLDASQMVHILWSWSSPGMFDGWHTYNVSESAGVFTPAAVGSPLTADMNLIDDTDRVSYIDTDKNVHDLRFNETTSVWSGDDINQLTSPVAPKAVP